MDGSVIVVALGVVKPAAGWWGGQHLIGDEGVQGPVEGPPGDGERASCRMSGARVGFIEARAGVRTRPWALLNSTATLRPRVVS